MRRSASMLVAGPSAVARSDLQQRPAMPTRSPASGVATPSVAPNPTSMPESANQPGPQHDSAGHRPPDRHRPASAQPIGPFVPGSALIGADMACRTGLQPASYRCRRTISRRAARSSAKAASRQPSAAAIRTDSVLSQALLGPGAARTARLAAHPRRRQSPRAPRPRPGRRWGEGPCPGLPTTKRGDARPYGRG